MVGMHANVNPRLAHLYQRAIICKTFPAYRLDELRTLPAAEIMQAMTLLDMAQKAQS